MFIGDIKTASPFRDLFPMSDRLIKEIYWDMQKNGFDETKPIALWESHGAVVIDGHTRLRAANKAGLIQVPVVLKRFETEQEALEYAIKCQRNRRSLTDREIMKCVDELDKRRIRGGSHGNQYTKGKVPKVTGVTFGKSSVETGKTLGIGRGKVEKARVVLEKGSDEVKEAVQSGNMTINSAYNQTVGIPKKTPPPKQKTPRQGTQESLELAAEEIASVEKIIDIINERLNKKQMQELIKRLVLGFSEKYKDEE
jgi:ParB family chromosome partitioning protein